MELAEGSLEQRLAQGPLSFDEALDVAEQIAGALQHLHRVEGGYVHRDVKTGNILRVGCCWKLSDFDTIRRKGETVVVVGTTNCMPIEAFQGVVSPANDLYALGRTLQVSLQGAAKGNAESLPQPLKSIVAGCLEPDSMKRWDAARVLKEISEHRSAVPPFWASVALATGFICATLAFLLGIEYVAAYRNLDNAGRLLAAEKPVEALAEVDQALALVPESLVALRARQRLMPPPKSPQAELESVK
jgi:serine/threonine protein kinase